MWARRVAVLVALGAVVLAGSLASAADRQESNADQDLRITLGGFVQDHPEGGKLGGGCGPDDTRNVLVCDIYNGLLGWTVTEVLLGVEWSPHGDDDKRFYRVSVSIEPLTTERVSVRLGLQLPPDRQLAPGTRPIRSWHWLIMNARGHLTK